MRKSRNERGAALVTMMMVSALLLAAGSAVIMTTSNSASNAFDSTVEAQAYYGAEAGLQAALNALRGNRPASPALPTGQKMNFRRAITLSDSNDVTGGDTSLYARLSRWLPYSDTAGNLSDAPTARVNVGNGVRFNLRVEEPPGTTTPAGQEPPRLLVTSTGYGPKGAKKEMQMLVSRSAFELDPPASIALVGGSSINLNLGDSNASGYSGNDLASPPEPQVPAVAATGAGNAATAQEVINQLNCGSTTCTGGTQITPSTVGQLDNTTTPPFLQSPDAARAFLAMMQATAASMGRSFTSQPATSDMGTPSNPQFTFIDNYEDAAGNPGPAVTLGAGHQGSGLLIVTGNLDTNGNTDFDGIILVLGRGRMTRSGGGNGVIRGTIIVANFDPDDPDADTFDTPTFLVSGGGSSTVTFDSVAVNNALTASGRIVLGVVEK